jgi:DNA-binding transcriptional MerR regulator
MTEYLLISKASKFLSVTTQTLRNWDNAGKLKAQRHPMNNYRLYKISDLEKILKRIEKQ